MKICRSKSKPEHKIRDFNVSWVWKGEVDSDFDKRPLDLLTVEPVEDEHAARRRVKPSKIIPWTVNSHCFEVLSIENISI